MGRMTRDINNRHREWVAMLAGVSTAAPTRSMSANALSVGEQTVKLL
jgi:hypothetical protein